METVFIIIGIAGLLVGIGSPLATLYVARRGGSFRQRAVTVHLGRCRLPNGRPLSAVYAVPGTKTLAITSLELTITNPGSETIEDLVLTTVIPEMLASFLNETQKQPGVKMSVERGADPGVAFQVQKVGIHYHLHITVPSIHPLVSMGFSIPMAMFSTTRQHIDVPVTFRDGVEATFGVEVWVTIPIYFLLIAKNQKAQQFTVVLECFEANQFRALAFEWLWARAKTIHASPSFRKKALLWLSAVFTFKRALLVLPQYKELKYVDTTSSVPKTKKDKRPTPTKEPVTILEEQPNSQRYAMGYIASLASFYRLLKRKPRRK